MASSLYIGPPGVGKSFALVRYVILPALERGQRVVTNVPLIQLAFEQRLGHVLDDLIVLVGDEEIKAPNFWFTSETDGETITQGGDCIVIDECHQFYGADEKIRPESEVFKAVRLQRKYTGGARNFSTNIVFASQLYEDVHRSVRNVCDSMYFMQKLTIVGRPNSYRVDIFADSRKAPTRSRPLTQEFGTYEPQFYELYESYSLGAGTDSDASPGLESLSDSRLNVLNRPIGFGPFKITLKQAAFLVPVLAICFIGYAAYSLNGFLGGLSTPLPSDSEGASLERPEEVAPPLSLEETNDPSTELLRASTLRGISAGLEPSGEVGEAGGELPYSERFRLVGLMQAGNRVTAVLSDGSPRYIYLADGFTYVRAGMASRIEYRGQVVAPWTGKPVGVEGRGVGLTPILSGVGQ